MDFSLSVLALAAVGADAFLPRAIGFHKRISGAI